MSLEQVNLVVALVNCLISFILAIKNGKGWWSAFFGWGFASMVQLQIVFAG